MASFSYPFAFSEVLIYAFVDPRRHSLYIGSKSPEEPYALRMQQSNKNNSRQTGNISFLRIQANFFRYRCTLITSNYYFQQQHRVRVNPLSILLAYLKFHSVNVFERASVVLYYVIYVVTYISYHMTYHVLLVVV